MRGSRAPIRIAAVGLALSCGSPEARAPVFPDVPAVLRVARPGWPSEAACEIPSDVQPGWCDPGFNLTASRGGPLIARVDSWMTTRVRWGALPRLGDTPVTTVTVESEGVEVQGWASFAEQTFSIKETIELVPGHLWIPGGSFVSVLGTTGPQVAIAVRTPFAAPELIEAKMACSNLGNPKHARPRGLDGSTYALGVAEHLLLRGEPGGALLLAARQRRDQPWLWLGTLDGYVRIAGAMEDGLAFEAWVREDEVRRAEHFEPDSDSGCDPRDTMDACPSGAGLRADTDLHVGAEPPGRRIGRVRQDAAIEVGEERSGFADVRLINAGVVPPPGETFWIRNSDVERGCGAATDGCPDCP